MYAYSGYFSRYSTGVASLQEEKEKAPEDETVAAEDDCTDVSWVSSYRDISTYEQRAIVRTLLWKHRQNTM